MSWSSLPSTASKIVAQFSTTRCPSISTMPELSSALTFTTSKSAHEGELCDASRSSSSIASISSCSQFPAVLYCASCSAPFTPFELLHTRSLTRSPRRLPIPPSYTAPPPSPSHSNSNSPSSTPLLLPSGHPSSPPSSILSLPSTQHPPCSSQPRRPLPKMPKYPPLLEIPGDSSQTDKRSSTPTSPATSILSITLPQRPTDIEEIRRRSLSKLRRHLGNSIPPDLVPPRLDQDDASSNSSSDEDVYCDLPTVPITPECLSELRMAVSPILGKTAVEDHERTIKRFSRRWLREKKGRRWVEDDYNIILQRLRKLR
ncbi:hypothetical protein F5148DRAFT_1224210 [Russula earlei]|uniref:Uncharacterized protein n=1 Tax=Russula earlei TaxID=71964 RepID=A0ACC0U215_9AGAM|nr:hypothetical protein F5148DRAFT_1224210 [Russula earlei]